MVKVDYPIFFATMQEPSKDNSGDKIYVTENYVTWTTYKYINRMVYIRKQDKVQITKEEYDNAEKNLSIQLRFKQEQRKRSTNHLTEKIILLGTYF